MNSTNSTDLGEMRINDPVILAGRKHWFILLLDTLPTLVLMILPFFFLPLFFGILERQVPGFPGWDVHPPLAVFLGSAWLLLMWARLAAIWTDYYLDVWYVTPRHVIAVEQKDLFHRQTSLFRMERIQDVTVEVSGFIATLLHFGTIHVQTAGMEQDFIMKGVANPHRVREIILAEHDKTVEKPYNRGQGSSEDSVV